jgi:hypothetical protein
MITQLGNAVGQTSYLGVTSDTLLSWLTTFLAAASALIGACLIAYARAKGKHLATRADFDELLRQAHRTTEVTEQIKSEISRGFLFTQSEFEHRKQQLQEFYGPIYAYLKLHEEFYELWRGGAFSEINEQIVRRFQKDNERMVRILATKAHLIDGPAVPDVFTRFTSNAILWNLYTSLPDGRYPEHIKKLPIACFPEDFRTYIYGKTEELKRLIDELHRKHSEIELSEDSTRPSDNAIVS